MTLYAIAKELSIKKGGVSDSSVAKFILFGRDALSELTVRGFYRVKSQYLEVQNMSAKLPSDFASLISIGICVCGRIIELDYDDTICIRESPSICSVTNDSITLHKDCCSLSEGRDLSYGHYAWDNIYYNGSIIDPMYTYPAYKSNGFYKISNGRIYLDSVCGSHASAVVIKYKSNGASDEGAVVVPPQLKPVVEAYMLWQDALYSKNNRGSARLYQEEYKRRKDLMVIEDVMTSMLSIMKTEMSNTYMANNGRSAI